jgi:hypothetical protein
VRCVTGAMGAARRIDSAMTARRLTPKSGCTSA